MWLCTVCISSCEWLPAVSHVDYFCEDSACHSWGYNTVLCVQTFNTKHRIWIFLKHFGVQVWLLADLGQMNTNTSRVKYSLAVILAFLPSFWICHGGRSQGWLSVWFYTLNSAVNHKHAKQTQAFTMKLFSEAQTSIIHHHKIRGGSLWYCVTVSLAQNES